MRMSAFFGGALVLGVALSASGFVAAKVAAPPRLEFKLQWQGQQGGPEKESREVFQDAEAFKKSWAASAIPAEEAKKIDFNTQTVVAVATGTRNTGGYAIAVTAIYDVPDYPARRGGPATKARLAVNLQETRPGPGAITIQVLTSPWHVVVIPKSAKPVEFSVSVKSE